MELQEVLDQIDSLKAEIDKLRPLDKETEERIMQKFRLDWNYHSNNIEGNSLTFGETKTFLLHGITAEGKPLKDHLDIKGHNEAILSLEDIVKNQRPLTETFIREMHKIILHEPYDRPAQTPDGKPTVKHISIGSYKTTPNHVKTATGEIFYFATPEETPAKMHDLMAWYEQAISENSLHPLIIAAEFHYRFIRIHPFDDGNGRIARILMNVVLMKYDYPPVIIKTQEKAEYYRALRIADGGDITSFVIYIGEQLIRSLKLYLKGAIGGNIEEMDDVDKEVALLKARLEGENTKVKYSSKNIQLILDQCLIPLGNAILLKLDQIQSMFDLSFSEIRIIGKNNEIGEGRVRGINITELLRPIQNKPIASFSIEYNFNDFIKTDKMFGVKCGFEVKLQDYQYLISTFHHSEVFKFYYSQTNTQEGFQKIANLLAKDALDLINKNLEN